MSRKKALEQIAKLREEVEDRMAQIAGLADEHQVRVSMGDLEYRPAGIWRDEDEAETWTQQFDGQWKDFEYWQSSTAGCDDFFIVDTTEDLEIV